MTTTTEYVDERDLSRDEIQRGIADGTLRAWRTDADGVQWYKRAVHGVPRGVIRGVPPKAEHAEKNP